MSDPRSTPAKGKSEHTSGRDGSESTIGPGPGSSLSSRSGPGQGAAAPAAPAATATTPQARKPSLSLRDPSATLSYVHSEVDLSGMSATDYSSGEEDGNRRGSQSFNSTVRGRANTANAAQRNSVSQSSVAAAAVGGVKGKRRASVAPRDGSGSKGRRQSRDRALNEDDDEGDNGRFGPLDDEDDEVEHIDRGEELVRRRMKARQKEKAARRKAEKQQQQQSARLQISTQGLQSGSAGGSLASQQPVSPRVRQASRQFSAPSPTQQSEQRDGRPMHISMPTNELSNMLGGSAASPSAATAAMISPSLRTPLHYPSPHSHIRRPGGRTSMADPATRVTSGTSMGNYSGTVTSARRPVTPSQVPATDVFAEDVAPSDDGTTSSLPEGGEGMHPDERDEIRDTIANLVRDLGAAPPRSEGDAARVYSDAIAAGEQQGAEVDEQEYVSGAGGGAAPVDEVEGDEDDDDNSGETGEDGSDGDVEYTLKDRQDAINIEHPFGLPIWKPALYKKSRTVTRNAESALHSIPSAAAERHLLPANLLWTMFAGVWLSVVCLLLAIIVNLLPFGGGKYARVIWELGTYLFWPFGKYVEVEVDPNSKERMSTVSHEASEDAAAAATAAAADGGTQEESYENSFTPVAARFPHDHKHTVAFNSRSASTLALTTHDTIRPGDTTAAQLDHDVEAEQGSGSRDSSGARDASGSSSNREYGAAKGLEESAHPFYSDAERIRQEADIYGYVTDDNGRDVGGAGRFVGKVAYGIAFWLVIAPLMGIVCLLCWGTVFPIPMAKLNWVLLKNLSWRPLALRFRSAPRVETPQQAMSGAPASETTPLLTHKRSILQQLKAGEPAPRTAKHSRDGRLVRRSQILVCTYRAMGLQYYKYTVGGVNILFVNTLPFIVFTIFDFFFVEPYVVRHGIRTGVLAAISSKGAMFVFALGSVLPLSYFIGMAVASISAQSSIGMGAVINATFGSIIEIILYAIALTQDKARLVEGSIVGSILAGVLLMPGVSMCSGAMRRKEQRFNARSAGVTSTMLIMAIIGILTPTLFYQIYGTFQLTCKGCPVDSMPGESWTCKRCIYEHVPPATDPFYQENVKGLMYTCTVVLVLSYGIGLWFSLRTHASQIWQNPQPQTSLPTAAPHAGHGVAGNAQDHPYPGGGHYPANPSLPPHGSQSGYVNLPPGQRSSMYKRILPPGILQQLMPGSHRAASGQSQTVRSNQSRVTALSDNTRDERDTLPPLHLPDSLTADEYERAGYGSNRRSSVMTNEQTRLGLPQPPTQQQQQQYGTIRGGSAPAAVTLPPRLAVNEADPSSNGHGGHDAPSWTRGTSMMVLISCTVLFAIIAEILVDAVDVVLEGSSLDIKLLGVTLFALVPNATEFMNAMSFAINGNIALSMEIGSAYALQVCLIQIPAMVAFSAFYQARHSHDNDVNSTFTLIFPRWDVIAIIFAIFLLTYTYIESRSNYFRGSLCILSYIVLISGFVFAPSTGDPEDPVEDQPGKLLRAIGFGGLQPFTPALPLATHLQAIFYSLWSR